MLNLNLAVGDVVLGTSSVLTPLFYTENKTLKTGKIVGEYKYFYQVDNGYYETSVLKTDLEKGIVQLYKLKAGEAPKAA